jgi:hypothetical protein
METCQFSSKKDSFLGFQETIISQGIKLLHSPSIILVDMNCQIQDRRKCSDRLCEWQNVK